MDCTSTKMHKTTLSIICGVPQGCGPVTMTVQLQLQPVVVGITTDVILVLTEIEKHQHDPKKYIVICCVPQESIVGPVAKLAPVTNYFVWCYVALTYLETVDNT